MKLVKGTCPALFLIFINSARKGIFSCNDSSSPFSKNMPQSIPFLVSSIFVPRLPFLLCIEIPVSWSKKSRNYPKNGHWDDPAAKKKTPKKEKNAKQLHSSQSFQVLSKKNSKRPVVVKERERERVSHSLFRSKGLKLKTTKVILVLKKDLSSPTLLILRETQGRGLRVQRIQLDSLSSDAGNGIKKRMKSIVKNMVHRLVMIVSCFSFSDLL